MPSLPLPCLHLQSWVFILLHSIPPSPAYATETCKAISAATKCTIFLYLGLKYLAQKLCKTGFWRVLALRLCSNAYLWIYCSKILSLQDVQYNPYGDLATHTPEEKRIYNDSNGSLMWVSNENQTHNVHKAEICVDLAMAGPYMSLHVSGESAGLVHCIHISPWKRPFSYKV